MANQVAGRPVLTAPMYCRPKVDLPRPPPRATRPPSMSKNPACTSLSRAGQGADQLSSRNGNRHRRASSERGNRVQRSRHHGRVFLRLGQERERRRRQKNGGEQHGHKRNQNRTMSQARHGRTPLLPQILGLRSAAPSPIFKITLNACLWLRCHSSRSREPGCNAENRHPDTTLVLPAHLLLLRHALRTDSANPEAVRTRRWTQALGMDGNAHVLAGPSAPARAPLPVARAQARCRASTTKRPAGRKFKRTHPAAAVPGRRSLRCGNTAALRGTPRLRDMGP